MHKGSPWRSPSALLTATNENKLLSIHICFGRAKCFSYTLLTQEASGTGERRGAIKAAGFGVALWVGDGDFEVNKNQN